MSILIKGMKMPKNCFDCPLFDDVYTDADGDDNYSCGLGVPLDYYQASGETNKDCPLVPIPAHGRLIDVDALEDNNITYYAIPVLANTIDATIQEAELMIKLKDLDNAPTIIPVEPEKEEMK